MEAKESDPLKTNRLLFIIYTLFLLFGKLYLCHFSKKRNKEIVNLCKRLVINEI